MTADPLIDKIAEAMYEDEHASTPGGWYKPWPEAHDSTVEMYTDRAEMALKVIEAEGRLLPVPVETRAEWGIQHFDGEIAEVAPRPGRIHSPHIHVYRREVRRYADKSTWTGPWVAADSEEIPT